MRFLKLSLSIKDRGAALLTTLVVISLITVIVISFFAMVGVAKRSSSYHKDSASLQNLKDSAISLALAQIREGTTREAEMWMSQPGVIRTFGESTGEPSQIYKLYSDDEMTVDASGLNSPNALNLVDDVPSSWEQVEGQYVDLNEPVASMTDKDLHFPIVDPRLYDGKADDTSATPEGFSYSKLHSGGGTVTGVLGPSDASHPNDQRIPMPVKWIYQLRDGSLGTLDDDGSFMPFASENPATVTNPIVGRFAFWTDDESTKINLNTASEAIPWDTPKAATPEDIEFAKSPPVRNEVQRFGGHPAVTSLSSVFFPNRELDPAVDQDIYEAIYDLIPRVNTGGYLEKSKVPVSFDNDRLYANVDEALLNPSREENLLFKYTGPGLLERSRFLLTANSRAPEVTAAGTPRVCLWPVQWQDNTTHRTAFDRLIAFNTIMNGRPYIFRRDGANTNIGEYKNYYVESREDPLGLGLTSNADLARYLIHLGAETRQGYPLSLENKYGRQNVATGVICFTEFMRQTNLQDSTQVSPGKRVVPYSRDYGQYVSGGGWDTELYGQVTNIDRGHLPRWLTNELGGLNGQISGIGTNGIGRIYVASEVGLVFSLAAENKTSGEDFNSELVDQLKIPEGFKAIQIAPIIEGFNPAQGYTMSAPSSSAQVLNLGDIRLGTSIGDRQAGGVVTDPSTVKQETENSWGNHLHSTPNLRNMAPGDPAGERGSSEANWWVGWGGSGGRYLYVGSNREQYSRGYFLVPSEDTTIKLNSTQASNLLWLRMGNQRNGDWSRHISRFLIPEEMTIPVPEKPLERKPTWDKRYAEARAERHVNPDLIDENDVVRTWVSRHGDHRLQYIRESEHGSLPPEKYLFVPHPEWDPDEDSPEDAIPIKQIHSFTMPGGAAEVGATFKRGIVRGVAYNADQVPDFTIDPDTDPTFRENVPTGYPYSVDPSETRDFDNGTGIAPDGAYWNKVDDLARVWNGGRPPYFTKRLWDGSSRDVLDETSAPNQQVPSGIVFGSLNSAAGTGLQWTTYLFRPEITTGGHLGSPNRTVTGNRNGAPPDHIMLDWFWMPVVQPYAISERFSTAGKINMNYRIAPFSYIKRATGLHAAFKSERLLAIPSDAGSTYKDYGSASSNSGWRHRIDSKETLEQFENKFNRGEVFKMESEICEQFLIPKGETLGSVKKFWDDHRLTGDNSLERPYANLYPRLTTRSNVYRIHLIAQTLRKSRDSAPDKFDPELNTFVGEYRGESLVERAIDPNDSEIPDYIRDINFKEPRLDNFYNYRILYNRRFAP